jgi:hypothetical protein
MKRFCGALALACISAACALAPAAGAAGPAVVNGGGHGTDGTRPFSQFGFNVTRSADGSVQGHFNCLMAGATQFPGFTLMAVRGQVTSVAIGGSTATFDGVGTFLAPGAPPGVPENAPATFHVEVTAGGPGVGTLHLTLLTPFFFDLPIEHVMNGQISIH